MYQQMVYNEYGEPMFIENVMDAQEWGMTYKFV